VNKIENLPLEKHVESILMKFFACMNLTNEFIPKDFSNDEIYTCVKIHIADEKIYRVYKK
jgi:hypothetical protein